MARPIQNDSIKLGRMKGQAVTVDVKTALDWAGEGYQKAADRATLTGFRKSTQIIRKSASRLAPVSEHAHRIVRTYPSGFRSGLGTVDMYPLSRLSSMKAKVGRRRGTRFVFYGLVKQMQGYAVFQNYGHHVVTRGGRRTGRKMPGVYHMQRGRDMNKLRVIAALRTEWPK